MIPWLSAEELLKYNAHKKVAVTATVAGDQEYQRELLIFQKEYLDNFMDKEYSQISESYEKQMDKYNENIKTTITSIVQDLESKSLTFVTDSQIGMNNFVDSIEADVKKTESKIKSEITCFKNELSLLTNELTVQMASFAQGVAEDIKQKCFDIKVRHLQEIAEIDQNTDKKIMEASAYKENQDESNQRKQYEAMVADLRSKFNSYPMDKKQKEAVIELHNRLENMKEELNKLKTKLFNSMTIVSSNILGFKKRAHHAIDDYKTSIFEATENEKKASIELNNYDVNTNREIEELKYAQTLAEDDFQTIYNDLQVERKENKATYDDSVDQITKLDQTDAEVINYLENLKTSFIDDEKDTRDAFSKLQQSISEKIESLTEKLSTNKEKFADEIEKLNSDHENSKEKFSTENDLIEFQNESEITAENKDFAEKNEKLQPLLLDFRERFAKYQNLSAIKQDLDNQLNDAKTYFERLPPEEPYDTKPFQEIFEKNIQANNAEENDIVISNDAQINAVLSDYQLQMTKIKNKYLELQEEAFKEIQEKFKGIPDYATIDLETQFANLEKEFKSIIIGDTTVLEARKKELQELRTQKSQVSNAIANEKASIIRNFRNEMITEDDRHQKALLNNLGMDYSDDQKLIDMRSSFEKRMKPLEEEEQKLTKEWASLQPKKSRDSSCLVDLTTDNEIFEMTEEMKRLKLEGDEKISQKNLEVQLSISNAKEENAKLLKQFEEDNQNEINKLKENKVKREQSIKSLQENLSKADDVASQRIAVYVKDYELAKSMMIQQNEEKKKSINDLIAGFKTSTYNSRLEFEQKFSEAHHSLEENAFNFSTQLENMASEFRSKRDDFVHRFDNEIEMRKKNIEILKEKYKNRPLGPKEKESLDNLSQKKQYLEKLSNLEKKTYKKYVVLGTTQESEFNERFGNTLNVGQIVQPNVRKRSSLELKKSPVSIPR
ncbi:hypothetical protein TVAG_054580 [Trichomonas vaginalis G3]|uniref:Uncharacterized protein n=1 Tax=Trichomonas vaginalis (strain ATCC PRA-98 / G3) TaxID=412133 RepID=A2EYD3_TRIV3|nr:hypothetical protein TVAGG3_0774050 [Trichomonas vaginalis G3]EAY02360.1 hypothetical protein TVAG_054580 [Trichomonas vaginalis G3]KAI5514028.1 hypothetical protein TVAGG3_0774050 [Trichomonas vaginalis G3]|eukprot:XP_001330627.1 hypothetical protein [Trichomonas vaginalis G3]